jgi:DNA invertase Pin-like site-specific DNA recombinase
MELLSRTRAICSGEYSSIRLKDWSVVTAITRLRIDRLDQLAHRRPQHNALNLGKKRRPPGRGGLAEFERDLIRTRTSEGRDRAKARGVKLGRKPKLTEHQKREAIRRRDRDGEPVREIARSYNVSHSTISRLSRRGSAPARVGLSDS